MVGGLYATVAIGMTLVFGIMGILNFAHGQMVMLGAYTAFFVVSAGFGFWPALLMAWWRWARSGCCSSAWSFATRWATTCRA